MTDEAKRRIASWHDNGPTLLINRYDAFAEALDKLGEAIDEAREVRYMWAERSGIVENACPDCGELEDNCICCEDDESNYYNNTRGI